MITKIIITSLVGIVGFVRMWQKEYEFKKNRIQQRKRITALQLTLTRSQFSKKNGSELEKQIQDAKAEILTGRLLFIMGIVELLVYLSPMLYLYLA